MFPLFQTAIHSHKQPPPIHSQTLLHITPASSSQTAASHSLPNIAPYYPRLVVTNSRLPFTPKHCSILPPPRRHKQPPPIHSQTVLHFTPASSSQTAASHSLPNIAPFYPRLVVTNSRLPFTTKYCSILPPPRRPRIPISSRCVLCLSGCLLTVCPTGPWTDWLQVSCCVCPAACWLCARLALGLTDCRCRVVLLQAILTLFLLCVCCQIQVWVGASGQPKWSSVCLSLIDDKLCLCFLAFSWPLPLPHLPPWCSCRVCFCLARMHPTPASHSIVANSSCIKQL